MAGFELDLREGVTLRACHVPGHKNPYLGIQEGSTFVALARFISDKDMEYLHDVLSKRIFIIQPREVTE
ncbi:hypothetical protein IT072_13890 [Leifsonia sp. ZF2019]|uniref:hypothetical protein n=1 Tax=Leifsonia sp. ZF2019 TaxID=2781978 RepID=UPI001CBB28CE|nr:hypothetical protein [Leifsonia sp. ZF2019]UAJ78349.1 hypothetical protein IT072_13890 [Leifsonia sp. ZF2019]